MLYVSDIKLRLHRRKTTGASNVRLKSILVIVTTEISASDEMEYFKPDIINDRCVHFFN